MSLRDELDDMAEIKALRAALSEKEAALREAEGARDAALLLRKSYTAPEPDADERAKIVAALRDEADSRAPWLDLRVGVALVRDLFDRIDSAEARAAAGETLLREALPWLSCVGVPHDGCANADCGQFSVWSRVKDLLAAAPPKAREDDHRVLAPEQVAELRRVLGDDAQRVLDFIGGDVAPDGFDPVAAVREDETPPEGAQAGTFKVEPNPRNVHSHPDAPAHRGQWRDGALVWTFADGREVTDDALRTWCYHNLDSPWQHVDVIRTGHLNAWAALNPKVEPAPGPECGTEERP